MIIFIILQLTMQTFTVKTSVSQKLQYLHIQYIILTSGNDWQSHVKRASCASLTESQTWPDWDAHNMFVLLLWYCIFAKCLPLLPCSIMDRKNSYYLARSYHRISLWGFTQTDGSNSVLHSFERLNLPSQGVNERFQTASFLYSNKLVTRYKYLEGEGTERSI